MVTAKAPGRSKDVVVTTYQRFQNMFNSTVHFHVGQAFADLARRGVTEPCVAVLATSNDLVADISDISTSHNFGKNALSPNQPRRSLGRRTVVSGGPRGGRAARADLGLFSRVQSSSAEACRRFLAPEERLVRTAECPRSQVGRQSHRQDGRRNRLATQRQADPRIWTELSRAIPWGMHRRPG